MSVLLTLIISSGRSPEDHEFCHHRASSTKRFQAPAFLSISVCCNHATALDGGSSSPSAAVSAGTSMRECVSSSRSGRTGSGRSGFCACRNSSRNHSDSCSASGPLLFRCMPSSGPLQRGPLDAPIPAARLPFTNAPLCAEPEVPFALAATL